jgi:hypothetical protein
MKSRNLITASVAAIVVAAAAILTAEPAFAGFGMSRGFSGSHMGMARGFAAPKMGMARNIGSANLGRNVGKLGQAPLGNAMRTSSLRNHAAVAKPHAGMKTAMAHPGDRSVGGRMYEKVGTAKPPLGSSSYNGTTTTVHKNGDGTRTVTTTDRDGKTTTRVTGHEPKTNGDRPVGGNMFEKKNTGKEPLGSTTFDGKTTTVHKNGDGTRTVTTTDRDGKTTTTVTGEPRRDDRADHGDRGGRDNADGLNVDWVSDLPAIVSYGSTEETGLVRVDDLPQNREVVRSNCALLLAKVVRLQRTLTHLFGVLGAIKGEVPTKTATATNLGTSYTSDAAQQADIARIESEIADTSVLLGRYQIDLARCQALQGG